MCLYTPVAVNTQWEYGNIVIKKDCPPGNRLKGIFLTFFDHGSNLYPLQWKHSISTTGLPGKSQGKFLVCFFFNIFSKLSFVNPIRTRKERKLCLQKKKKKERSHDFILVCSVCRSPVPQTRQLGETAVYCLTFWT